MSVFRRFLATVLFLGLVLLGQTGFAQAPTGSLTNHVVGATNAIWDVSLFQGLQSVGLAIPMSPKVGTNYWKCLQAGANPLPPVPGSSNTNANFNQLEVDFNAPYVQDGHGRLSGGGTNVLELSYINRFWTEGIFGGFYDNTNMLDLTNIVGSYTARGTVKGIIGGTALMNFWIWSTAPLPMIGAKSRLKATDANYVVIDAVRKELRESYSHLISVTGQHTLQSGGPNKDAIPGYLGNGTWTLVLNFDAASTTPPPKLSGQATVTLNSGAVYPFTFTGRYSPTTGKSALLLKGVDDEQGTGKGSTLAVTVLNDQVTGLLGRVAGQIIRQK